MADFEREYVDVKKDDAQTLVAYLNRLPAGKQLQIRHRFLATGHWRGQFEKALRDVPPLR
jgi:hypothetical protein